MRLVPLVGVLALAAVVLAGCGGGGDDQAKVEAGLRHHLVSLVPEHNPFPMGAGTPRLKANSCKDRHIKVEKGHVIWSRTVSFMIGRPVALWTCVVKFGTLATPVNVVVDDRTGVVHAVPGELLKVDKPNASQPSAGWSPYPRGRQRR
jgi:hypothetical protein